MSRRYGRCRSAVPAFFLVAGLALQASAATVVVTELPKPPVPPTDSIPGVWYDWFTTNTGAATIVDLAGEGGDLETNQPLPTGAALLTTQFDNADRANAGVFDVLGSPADVFPSLEMSYWFHKAANPGQNLNAAPALKLEIANALCDDPSSAGDCFGTLIYEPYVNGFGVFPTQDLWQQAVITPTFGGFWWSGGFGVPSSGGGPPYRTLTEWLTFLNSDFDDAVVVTVQVGVGSFNQGQVGYFDEVRLAHSFGDGLDVTYDFQSVTTVGVDLRPGSAGNQVNTNSQQLVPVAILGAAGFDPTTEVDPESVLLRGAAEALGTKQDEVDVNGDGFADLTLYFRARTIPKPTEDECTDPDARMELTGSTFGGASIAGDDFVDWQGPDCNF